ncbi:unnamed protein product [Paramecium sonneborni]|uniref:Uncharacterized protein n=1 Tax=Paramecium sonneborni TaxID=65129 RepID=A0A8S1MMJ6_9CILI|nr:unnamed protein product [Paramecium sonneborni]
MLNQKAKSDPQLNKLESCYNSLEKAQQMNLLVPNLKFQTLNNLALNHQKIYQPKRSLNYLNQPLKIEYTQNFNSSLLNTYLNIGAIQSIQNAITLHFKYIKLIESFQIKEQFII